jgi:hypothetical protein
MEMNQSRSTLVMYVPVNVAPSESVIAAVEHRFDDLQMKCLNTKC